MKKLIAIAGLLLSSLAGAQTTTVVTGLIKDLAQNPVATGSVTFGLRPSLDTTISGTARFTNTVITCSINQMAVGTNQAVRSGNSVTISGLAGHTFLVGDILSVYSMTDTTFNGVSAFTITAITASSITYAQTAGNATSGGGIVSALRGGSNGTAPGSCVITQNTALSPGGTSYLATEYPAGVKTAAWTVYATTPTLDISTVVPTPSTLPIYAAGALVDLTSTQTIVGTKTFISINSVQYAQPGADIGLSITAAAARLPATGGTVDAALLLGTQTCATDFTIGSPGAAVKLKLPEGIQASGACHITIGSSMSGIEWEGNVPSYDFDQPTTAPWTYTATTGCGITVSAGVRGAFVRNLLFRGANTAGTGNGLCATGDSSNSTAITGLDLSGSDFDEFPQDGIHLVGSVYGLNWVKTRATRNHRYGLAALYDGSNAANVFNQAQLFGFNATGNYSAQEHFESAGGSVDFMQLGGTVADTNAVCTTDCNGIEIVTAAGTGSSKAIIQGVHFESIGGSVDTPSPDTVNAEIYINTQSGADVISGNFFVNGGPHTHNAITLGSAATCKTLQIGPGDAATGQYATTFFDSTLPAGGGCGRTTIAENVGAYPASAFATGNITTNYVGGQFYRDDGTNFLFRNSAGTTVASVANATGIPTFPPVNTAGVGGFWPVTITAPQATNAGALDNANNENRVIQFVLPYAVTVSKVSYHISVLQAASTGDIGIYNSAGTLLANTAGFATTSNGNFTANLSQGTVTLPAGVYYSAACDSNSGVLVTVTGFGANIAGAANNGTSKIFGTANACTAGVLPATLGTITADTTLADAVAAYFER